MFRPKPIKPEPGQESVWDYPRPPRLEQTEKHIQIVANGITIADTHRAYPVLETSHPPGYYLPPEDIEIAYLRPSAGGSWCEWKGQAKYYTVVVRNYVSFYPTPMDVCYVDGERVTPQTGGFYGGWITSDIVGPFKGEPGTRGW